MGRGSEPSAHRGAFYRWKENAYPEIVDTELRSELYDFLDRSFVIKNGKTVRVKPNQAMVTNVLDGLRGASHLSGSISAPAWLSHGDVLAEETALFLPVMRQVFAQSQQPGRHQLDGMSNCE